MPPRSSMTSLTLCEARWCLPLTRLVLVIAISLTGAACGDSGGGGGDSGGGGSSGGPVDSPATLEIFQASLDAIDPDAPDTVIAIDPSAAEIDADSNPVGALPSIGGTFTDGNLSSAKAEWVVYPRNDGTLQRVATDLDAGTPTPIRVSSEADALPCCDALIANDMRDATNARLAYGSDGGSCSGDLAWRVVTLSDDELTDPRDFPGQPLEALVDPETGAHRGWLAIEDGRLNRLAPDLSVHTADLLVGVELGEAIGATANGTLFLEIDQNLYAYDLTANRLKDLNFEFSAACPCGASFASDREYGFVVDSGELRRADPSRGRTELIDAPDDALPSVGLFDFVTVGSSRVAWSYTADADGDPLTQNDQETVIRSIDRDGSGALTLDRYELAELPLPSFSGFVAASSDEWLFYNRLAGDRIYPSSMSILLAGGEAQINLLSLWVGSSREPALGPAHLGPVTRMLRLGGLDDLTNLPDNSLRLRSIDPDDPRGESIALGDLPSDALFAYALPGFGPSRVGVLLAADGFGGLQSDLISWDDETADSLRRVTDTNGQNELPAAHF